MFFYIGNFRCTSLCRVICKALDSQEQRCCHMLALELLISADFTCTTCLLYAVRDARSQVPIQAEHIAWQDMPLLQTVLAKPYRWHTTDVLKFEFEDERSSMPSQ